MLKKGVGILIVLLVSLVVRSQTSPLTLITF